MFKVLRLGRPNCYFTIMFYVDEVILHKLKDYLKGVALLKS